MKEHNQHNSHILHRDYFHLSYIALLILNALLITLKISSFVSRAYHPLIDMGIFALSILITAEIIWRVMVEKEDFFKNFRNIFTVAVLVLSGISGHPEFMILLIFSSFRFLRRLKKMRHLTDTLLHILPGVANLLFLILLIFFISAVLATYLFGAKVPDLWGDISKSLITLQQISLGDSWGDNLRITLKSYPYSWIFFQTFLVIITFVLLNLFIGILMDGLRVAQDALSNKGKDITEDILAEIKALRLQVTSLEENVKIESSKPPLLPNDKSRKKPSTI